MFLLAHHDIRIGSCFFFALLKLVFQRLCINPDSSITDDLLASARGYGTTYTSIGQLAYTLKS